MFLISIWIMMVCRKKDNNCFTKLVVLKTLRLSFVKHLALAIILCSTVILSGKNGYTKVENCTVGDETTGHWKAISTSLLDCEISGSPAPDSQWPTAESFLSVRAHVVKGKYLLSAYSASSNWRSYIPPSGPGYGCITGFADTYTAMHCAYLQSKCEANPSCNNNYSASGNLCTCTFTSPNNTVVTKRYVRFSDSNFRLLEWVCNEEQIPDVVLNQGSPCPPGQCCD